MLRAREIGVLAATLTMSQGINAPCRTVVIAQDSTYMNPTNFKQMIGRAGRRGFDLVGECDRLWCAGSASLRTRCR
jgi:replicative superfamily II helicase